jgi:uncharacterized protein involved in propanediol utilization
MTIEAPYSNSSVATRNRWEPHASPSPGAPSTLQPGVSVGVGSCQSHHGELLQGRFSDKTGDTRPALVTLPCPLFTSTAIFRLTPAGPVEASSTHRKAARSAELVLSHLGLDKCGGRLEVRSTIPRARGLGSSTADVIATARAVVNAAGRTLSAPELGTIAVAAETASDSLMYDQPTLFAQRDGVALEVFENPLPPFTVVGGDLREGGPGLDTVATPMPQYTRWELAGFHALRGAMRRALTVQDGWLVAQVATASARINQTHRPLPGLDEVLSRYLEWGVLGVQVAHSGTVVGMLCRVGDRRAADAAARGLRTIGVRETWSFDAGTC